MVSLERKIHELSNDTNLISLQAFVEELSACEIRGSLENSQNDRIFPLTEKWRHMKGLVGAVVNKGM